MSESQIGKLHGMGPNALGQLKAAMAVAGLSFAGGSQSDPAVDAFLDSLDHPQKAEAQAVRGYILGVSDAIQEGIKWNSMSFRTSEWFATFNWRTKDRLEFVLHLGAKAGKEAAREAIPDSKGLLKWLGADRAMLMIPAEKVETHREDIEAIVRAWIAFV